MPGQEHQSEDRICRVGSHGLIPGNTFHGLSNRIFKVFVDEIDSLWICVKIGGIDS